MHELAIAQSLADLVSARAAEAGATRVTSVRLRIGTAAGVVPDALRSCFAVVANEETVLAGAALLIDLVPHRARCPSCVREFEVIDFVARCPACGAWSADVVSGTELEVREMEIDTGAADMAAPEEACAQCRK